MAALAAFIARTGVPIWLLKLVAMIGLAGVVVLGVRAGYAHVFNAGVTEERAAQHARDVENDRVAAAAVALLNARVAAAQAALALARAEVNILKRENEIEKTNSGDLQQRLVSGEQRMRVLIRTAALNPAGPGAGAGAVIVDPGTAIEANLDGTVAANLEWLRSTRDQAIKRLDGCVIEYDALKAAVDATQ